MPKVDLGKLESSLAKVTEMLREQDQIGEANHAKVTENIGTIAKIVSAIRLAFGDGVQWSDVTVVGEVVPLLMKMAAGFVDYKGTDKRQFVIETVWLTYKVIDTFPDGKRNNINLPWVAGAFERRVERAVVAFAAGMAMDALYPRMKRDGEV